MATLAAIFRRPGAGLVARAQSPAAERPAGDPQRLRPLFCEDVYLYVKKIDNSRVVRQADPQARSRCARAVAVSVATAVLLIALMLPTGLNVMAGYQISDLERQRTALESQRKLLLLEEARMLNPARMHQLATDLKMVDPDPGRVIYTGAEEALALNAPGK
jgi:hypothetical protein